MTTTLDAPARAAGHDLDDVRVRSRAARLLLGPADQAAWVRPAFLAVTLLAVVVYTWNLAVSGFANAYYSAAAQAASQSWTAWFFGSLDASNFITVDKPPLATMLMGLSVRLFGLSSTSILLPEALAGVAAVVVLYAAVRHSFGAAAATIAAVVMALTPAAVLIFRYNNPDALLTLLLVTAAWALIRSLQTGRLRWVILAAALVGLAFNTKYLQAYLVLPGFALTYALCAPGALRRRIAGLVVAAVTVLVTSAWWVAAVELVPTAARPYIGGSTTDSALQLLLGYDGLGRIFGGAAVGGGGGPAGAGGFGGASGLLRMFNADFGGQVAWLLPLAFAALVIGLWVNRRAGRADRRVAGYVLWGSWLATHVLVFSLMSGIIHSYYAVILAPAIGALVGAGVVELWGRRERAVHVGRLSIGGRLSPGGLALGAAFVASALLAAHLLDRSPAFAPGLGIAVLALAAAVAIVLAIPPHALGRAVSLGAVAIGLIAILAGPAAYAIDTMGTAYSGGDPKAGPAVAGDQGSGPFGGGGGPGMPAGDGGQVPPTGDGGPGGPGVVGSQGDGGQGDGIANSALVDYLLANRGSAAWIVAVRSSQGAAGIQLAAGAPVMAMGGFTGSDPAPTLDELRSYVRSGQLRFVLLEGSGSRGPGGSGTSSDVTTWVGQACSVVDVGATISGTLYDCAGAGT